MPIFVLIDTQQGTCTMFVYVPCQHALACDVFSADLFVQCWSCSPHAWIHTALHTQSSSSTLRQYIRRRHTCRYDPLGIHDAAWSVWITCSGRRAFLPHYYRNCFSGCSHRWKAYHLLPSSRSACREVFLDLAG